MVLIRELPLDVLYKNAVAWLTEGGLGGWGRMLLISINLRAYKNIC